MSFYLDLVTWLKWEELPLTVSDAVDKGWTLQDKCQGKGSFITEDTQASRKCLYTLPGLTNP